MMMVEDAEGDAGTEVDGGDDDGDDAHDGHGNISWLPFWRQQGRILEHGATFHSY